MVMQEELELGYDCPGKHYRTEEMQLWEAGGYVRMEKAPPCAFQPFSLELSLTKSLLASMQRQLGNVVC